ncbi:adenylate kinase [Candidatus Peribacteria bacterium]|jgi:adenylate kinase|nr:adenylate kinase [Candidatus Peribacteria bacterium]MBT4021196.1 adenylate kinase [Candidatus Peribacteria bacterium]MBT4474348.1 adenylate kinase [Candidatus Peribacteria bacterium]
MDLLLFGIQGSGKGTQAKKIAETFEYDIFEAGGELRKIAASGSELGEKVKSYIDEGELVPHEIIMNVVKESISSRNPETKILFDGIPRDENQQKDFDEIMQELDRDFRCIQIDVDTEECIQRILKRAESQGRADDANEKTVRKRMNTFLEKTMPVIEAYKATGKVDLISGDGTVEEVFERIKLGI